MQSRLRPYKAKHVEKHIADKALHFFHSVFHTPFHSAIGLTFVAFVALTFASLVAFSTSEFNESQELLSETPGIRVAQRSPVVKGVANAVAQQGQVAGLTDLIKVAQAADEPCNSAFAVPNTTCKKTGNVDPDNAGPGQTCRNCNGVPNEPVFDTMEYYNRSGQMCYPGRTGSNGYQFTASTTMQLCSGGGYFARGEGNLGSAMTVNRSSGQACFQRYNGDGSFARTVCQNAILYNANTNTTSFRAGIYTPCNGRPAGTNDCVEFNPITGAPMTRACRVGAYEVDSGGATDLTRPLDLTVPDCAKVDNPLGFTPPATGVHTPQPTTTAIQGGCYYQYSQNGTDPRQVCLNSNGATRQPNLSNPADQLSFAVGQLMLEPFGEITTSNATVIEGWAVNPQNITTPLKLRIYVRQSNSENEEFIQEVTADIARPDLFPAEFAVKMGVQPVGFAAHGFRFDTPEQAGVGDTIVIYAVKPGGGWNPLIDARQIVSGSGTSTPPPGRGNARQVLQLIFNHAQPVTLPPSVTPPSGPINIPRDGGGDPGGSNGPVDCSIVRGACEPRIGIHHRNLERCGNYGRIVNGAPSRACDIETFTDACPGEKVTMYVGVESPWPGTVKVKGQEFKLAGGPGSRPSTHYAWGSLAAFAAPEYFEVTVGEDDLVILETNGQTLTARIPVSSSCGGGSAPAVTVQGFLNDNGTEVYCNQNAYVGGILIAYGDFANITQSQISGGTKVSNTQINGTGNGAITINGVASPTLPVVTRNSAQDQCKTATPPPSANFSLTVSPNPLKVCSASETGTATVTISGPAGTKAYNNATKVAEVTSGTSANGEVTIGFNSSTPIRLYRPDGSEVSSEFITLTSSAGGC